MSSQELVLKVPYVPHSGQQIFHDSEARFRVLACGRRWGKTKCGAAEAVKRIVMAGEDSVGFIVAPTFTSTSLGKCWREFLRYCPKELIRDYPKGIHRTPGDRFIELLGKRMVYFKSADRPDTLAGEGLAFVWCDEPAQYHEDVWERVLPPALMDRKGLAWFTGTPKGRNWYFRLYMEGQDPLNKDVRSWNFSSYQNAIENGGYIPKAEIDAIANRLPEHSRMQEIYGLFLEDVGTVFRGVENCIIGGKNAPKIEGNYPILVESPIQNKQYIIGSDIAKFTDFTVNTVMDENAKVIAIDRFGEIDYPFQRKRIVELAKKYNDARVLIDSSGPGTGVYDDLRVDGIRVEGYKFTHASKAELVENLSIMMEQGKISYPNIPELIAELKVYGYTTSKGGNIIYGAPSGHHDDMVISLALASWLARTTGPMDVGSVNVAW